MMFRFVLHGLFFVFLTIVTQLGGIAYLVALYAVRFLPRAFLPALISRCAVFVIAYGVLWFAAAVTAPGFGRVAIPCHVGTADELVMHSLFYCATNRHYVAPDLKVIGDDLATYMNGTFAGTTTLALDGGFPFLDGFPLLPHLSHDDGRKLDLAFWYQDGSGTYLDGVTKSPIGYWGFEDPVEGSTQPCADYHPVLSMRWDMTWFQPLTKPVAIEEQRTGAALRWLNSVGVQRGISKIFVEPHLAERLGVSGDAIRFQGCRAARHDDHIHIQIR